MKKALISSSEMFIFVFGLMTFAMGILGICLDVDFNNFINWKPAIGYIGFPLVMAMTDFQNTLRAK